MFLENSEFSDDEFKFLEPDSAHFIKVDASKITFENADAKIIEKLFKTKLRFYQDKKFENRKVVRCDENGYFLPAAVAPSIAFIEGLANFYPTPKKKYLVQQDFKNGLRGRWLENSEEVTAFVVPQTLAGQYNYSLEKLVSKKVRQMPGECDAFVPDGGSFLPTDLKTFLKDVNLPDFNVSNVRGSGTVGEPGIEGSLDVQYVVR